MKKSPVKVVAHPETGNVVTPNENKPGEASIRLDQEVNSMEGGYLNKSRRTVFIGGKIEDLQSLNFRAGQTLPGKIVRRESFEPFYEGQSPKINPTSGEIMRKNGQEIYFQFQYTENETEPDYLWLGSTEVEVSESVQQALSQQTLND